MIDVHILVPTTHNFAWLDTCLESLHGQPCVVHVVRGYDAENGYEHPYWAIANGRKHGWGLGSCEYSTYVDSDDYVLPGAMETCLEHLSKGFNGVMTFEQVVSGGAVKRVQPRHHLLVARKSAVVPHLPNYLELAKYGSCYNIFGRMVPDAVQIPEVCYAWREDGYGTHQLPRHELIG